LPSGTANRCKTIDRLSRNSPLEIADHQAAHTPLLTLALSTRVCGLASAETPRQNRSMLRISK
jgi:hypothetical protein